MEVINPDTDYQGGELVRLGCICGHHSFETGCEARDYCKNITLDDGAGEVNPGKEGFYNGMNHWKSRNDVVGEEETCRAATMDPGNDTPTGDGLGNKTSVS